MFGLLRGWKRRRLLKREFPGDWIGILERGVPFYANLPGDLQRSFRDKLKVFVWEKHFFGADDLEVTDEMRVVIGAAAVRLIMFLDLSYYDRLSEIVVYPHHYRHKDDDAIILGEAHHWGTVVLSWPAVLHGLKNPCDGHDTATHEFAHVLDRTDGSFDGTPRLRASEDYRAWARIMSAHFLRLQRGDARELFVLREYGAKNEAEFFAVATESFFERPLVMKKAAPDLYAELKRFYGFDPASDPTCGFSSNRP
jgi:Mlc titration factor MtfA (ptsG expression regulator)